MNEQKATERTEFKGFAEAVERKDSIPLLSSLFPPFASVQDLSSGTAKVTFSSLSVAP